MQQENKNNIQKTEVRTAIFYQGDFPHPDIIKGLQEIDPTFPERIMRITEAAAEDRIRRSREKDALDRMMVEKEFRYKGRNQWLAFFTLLFVMSAIALFAWLGLEIAAYIGIVSTLIVAVTSVWKKDNSQK